MTKKEMKQWIKENKWYILAFGAGITLASICKANKKPKTITRIITDLNMQSTTLTPWLSNIGEMEHLMKYSRETETLGYEMFFNQVALENLGEVGKEIVDNIEMFDKDSEVWLCVSKVAK